MESQLLMGYLPRGGVVIRVVGRGTMHESPAFREAAHIALGGGRLVCDMTDCEYLDSTFLGCLIGVQKLAEQNGPEALVIAADHSTQIKLFSTSSLDRYFQFVDEAPRPTSAWVAIEGDQLDREALSRHVLECHRRLADRGGVDGEAFRRVCDRLSQELDEQSPRESKW
jgi:anti-anti-sigma factor